MPSHYELGPRVSDWKNVSELLLPAKQFKAVLAEVERRCITRNRAEYERDRRLGMYGGSASHR